MGNSGGSIISNDFSVKGLMRSFGDCGAGAADKQGGTLLKRLDIIDANLDALELIVRSLDGDTGVQVDANGNANNATTIVHTVTAGKSLYLQNAFITTRCTALRAIKLRVRDVADATVWEIPLMSLTTSEFAYAIIAFSTPRVIPAGYDICFVSGEATSIMYGSIHGWEEV